MEQENSKNNEQPVSPAAVPTELMGEWATLRYEFEVAKFQELVEKTRRENLVDESQTAVLETAVATVP